MTECYHCNHIWNRKVEHPKLCPNCGRDWRRPTIRQRFSAAIEAFKMKPKGEVVHREPKQQLKLDDAMSNAIAEYGVSGQVPMQNIDSV